MLVLIGVIFGFGVKNFPRGKLTRTRAFLSGFVVTAIFSGVVYYSYLLAPDWMFNYVVRASDVPRVVVALIFVGYFLAYALGFWLKIKLDRLGWGPVGLLMLLLAGASAALPMAFGKRYTQVGSYEAFVSGTAVPLAESFVGGTPTYITIALVPVGILLIFWARRERS